MLVKIDECPPCRALDCAVARALGYTVEPGFEDELIQWSGRDERVAFGEVLSHYSQPEPDSEWSYIALFRMLWWLKRQRAEIQWYSPTVIEDCIAIHSDVRSEEWQVHMPNDLPSFALSLCRLVCQVAGVESIEVQG